MSTTLRLVGAGETQGFCAMIGDHPSMLCLFDALRRAARLSTPALIEGPTGSGKELAARALHELAGLGRPFVDLNVAALPETLADAELFGTVRGAYTGAITRRGLLERANGGTLLLDEAGDMAGWLQTKLLRALETQTIRRVGGEREQRVQFRLVVTTQRPAVELVASGLWRPDFYYRVAGISIRVPSLAERPTDIPLLVNAVLAENGHAPIPAPDAAILAAYPWPGNVRELRRAVERAAFETGSNAITAEVILGCVEPPPIERRARTAQASGARTKHAAEAEQIEMALRDADFDTRVAAASLGICRSHLYRRMRWLGITVPTARANTL